MLQLMNKFFHLLRCISSCPQFLRGWFFQNEKHTYVAWYKYIFLFACEHQGLHGQFGYVLTLFEIFTLLRSRLLIIFHGLAVPTCRWRGSACSASRKLMEIPDHAWGGRAAASKWRMVTDSNAVRLENWRCYVHSGSCWDWKSTHANVQAMKPVREMVQHSDSETQKMSGEKGWPLGIELDSSETSICFQGVFEKRSVSKNRQKMRRNNPFTVF